MLLKKKWISRIKVFRTALQLKTKYYFIILKRKQNQKKEKRKPDKFQQ